MIAAIGEKVSIAGTVDKQSFGFICVRNYGPPCHHGSRKDHRAVFAVELVDPLRQQMSTERPTFA
jgi:hypothetical protein